MRPTPNKSQLPNVRTREFKNRYRQLPIEVQDLAVKAYKLFLSNPDHPGLFNKELAYTRRGHHRTGSYSVRISMSHRAIYVRDGETNVWYWIGSHSDYNEFTGSSRK